MASEDTKQFLELQKQFVDASGKLKQACRLADTRGDGTDDARHCRLPSKAGRASSSARAPC
jgi:hypothetical protein